MAQTTGGVVRGGVIIPDDPLPEGLCVEITLATTPLTFSPEMQAEFEEWDRASAEALDLVERLAR